MKTSNHYAGYSVSKSESNKAVANLMHWIRREENWAAPFGEALHEHTVAACAMGRKLHGDAGPLSQEELEETLGGAGSALLFGCVFEDLTARHFERAPHNIVDDYLKRRGWRDSVPCRRYMLALRDAIMSMYEVTDVSPGKWVEVRDLVRGGGPMRVFEHSASQQLVRWDRIGVRVVDYLGQKVFTGALLAYSVEQSESLLRLIDATIAENRRATKRKGSKPDGQALRALADDALSTLPAEFTAAWLAQHLRAANAPLPDLVNFEGDEIMFAETRFTLREGAAPVIARLDALKHLHRVDDAPPTWDWQGNIDAPRNSRASSKGFMLQTRSAATGELVLATVKLEGGVLWLSTNSVERKERGIGMLNAALGDLIDTGLTSLTNVERALEQSREGASTKPNVDDAVPPEIAAKVVRQLYDQHYRAWIDMPVPALDGRTPRQALQTKRGKEEVAALLKIAENNDARRSRESGEPPYDFGWLWQELGLESHRS